LPGPQGAGIVALVLITPDDPGYDEARKVWNGAIDRRPALIARCRDSGDVVAALRLADERGLAVAVRGGGHGVAGLAVCDDGLVVDVSLMKDIAVDPDRRTARAGGGVLWGELDAVTQAHGLATVGGIVTHTARRSTTCSARAWSRPTARCSTRTRSCCGACAAAAGTSVS
jgi:FAD/FMN-containing dehydrogenase